MTDITRNINAVNHRLGFNKTEIKDGIHCSGTFGSIISTVFFIFSYIKHMRRRKGLILVFSFFLFLPDYLFAQDGKALFQINCAQCHNPIKVITGPALKGVSERVTDKKLLHTWIHNNQQVLSSGNIYFNNLYQQYGKAPMNTFPGLTDAEIDAIIKYVDNYTEPFAATNTSVYSSASQADNTLLYGILSFILAIFAFGLFQLNIHLKKLSETKEGISPALPIPFYRNKIYIAASMLAFFVAIGFWLVQFASGLGRNKNYQPEQPVFFSHKVHAGLNQISCLFCHGDAWESKQASIPSLNICMNCHTAINDYKGERLERENGDRINPDEELKKLYSFTGYDPEKRKYTKPGKPVEWIKIHNLPDHVFFSHAQHVRAGKVQCQTCHGPVQEMDEIKQFADLSMGWCINCHRTTRVDFPDSAQRKNGNKFYTTYQNIYRDLKYGKIDSVTVETIGGTECQKCHY
jgi:cytochrome c551/c552